MTDLHPDLYIATYFTLVLGSVAIAVGLILIGYGMARLAAKPPQPPKEKNPKTRDVKPTEDILDDPFSKAAMGIRDEEGIQTYEREKG